MKKSSLILLLILSLFPVIISARTIYFVGGFNGWDITSPLIVAEKGGICETVIDFSDNTAFKMSTVSPDGAWGTFDRGTLYPLSDVVAEEWIAIGERTASPNIQAPSRDIYTVRIDLDNMRMIFYSGGELPTPWSGTLPVLFIDTEGGAPVVSKETYLKGSYRLDPMGNEGIEAIGSEEEMLPLQIKGRGNYTWIGFDKKPYRLKLDKKAPLCGMEKSKHFALLAHTDDSAAGLRNALGFAASETLLMPWTPVTKPVEVVLNGDYIGLYWLTETIRVDSDRVDVVEQADEALTDVDGGWLVEIDNYNTDPHVTIKGSDGNPIWFTYKSPEILSTAQSDYLKGAMQSIQDALSAGDVERVAGLVDFDILARFFIVNQIMLDMESFHGSCYLNRNRGADEKWKFGPVWDFGNSFAPKRADAPRFIFDHPDFSQVWIGDFYKIPRFVENVKEVWGAFVDGNGAETLQTRLAGYASEIEVAAVSDARRWPMYSHADVGVQAEKLKDYLSGSIDWLIGQWGNGSEVAEIEKGENLNVYVKEGALVVEALEDTIEQLYGIDGTVRSLRLKAGTNSFPLLPGFYIIRDKKIKI